MFSSLCARHREREPLSSQPSREDGVKIPIIEMKMLRLSEVTFQGCAGYKRP